MRSMAGKIMLSGLTALVMATLVPSAALACIPPRSLTAAEQEAQDLQVQTELWARHDMIFAATVTAVSDEGADALDPDEPPRVRINDTIRVRLEPTVMVKGDGALPAPYEIRNIFVGCAPRGLARAQVGQRYLVYGAPSSEYGRAGGIVEIDRLRDAETIVAVYQAATLTALEP